VEVSRFVADTTLLTQTLAIPTKEDPLHHLPELIESIRKQDFAMPVGSLA
jgi:hypothetical protein